MENSKWLEKFLIFTPRNARGRARAPLVRCAVRTWFLVSCSGATPIRCRSRLPYNALIKRLKAGRFKSTLFNLKVDGHEDVRVICRDVQRDIVKDLPTHVDFMRLRRTTKINLFIHDRVRGRGRVQGAAQGWCSDDRASRSRACGDGGDIPEKIVVDLTKMENIGDTLTISMIDLPAGAKPTIDRDFVICNISAPSALKSQEDEDEDEAEASAVRRCSLRKGLRKRPDAFFPPCETVKRDPFMAAAFFVICRLW